MGLISTFTSWLSGRNAGALKTLADLARAEADGKQATDRDAEALQRALVESGKSLDDFNAMVGVFRHAAELKRQIGNKRDFDADVAKMWAASNKLAAHPAETAAMLEARTQEFWKLTGEANEARSAVERRDRARCNLEVLEFENAALFGLEFLDLDGYALTCYGSRLEGPAEDSPCREVPRDIFKREAARREQMQVELFQSRLAKCAQMVTDWNDARGAMLVPENFEKTNPPPKHPSYPTWGETFAGMKAANA